MVSQLLGDLELVDFTAKFIHFICSLMHVYSTNFCTGTMILPMVVPVYRWYGTISKRTTLSGNAFYNNLSASSRTCSSFATVEIKIHSLGTYFSRTAERTKQNVSHQIGLEGERMKFPNLHFISHLTPNSYDRSLKFEPIVYNFCGLPKGRNHYSCFVELLNTCRFSRQQWGMCILVVVQYCKLSTICVVNNRFAVPGGDSWLL